MKNIVVTMTMLLDKEMSEEEIEKMIDYGVLKMSEVKRWTVKIDDKPDQWWDEK